MRRVRIVAAHFFEEQGLSTLPITERQLREIIERNGWRIFTYAEGEIIIKERHLERYANQYQGFTYRTQNEVIIFIRDDLGFLQKISVICHEIGHITLNHTCYNNIMGKSSDERQEAVQEQEADAFSLELQAPVNFFVINKIDSPEKLVDKGILSEKDAFAQYDNYLHYKASLEQDDAVDAMPSTQHRRKFLYLYSLIVTSVLLVFVIAAFTYNLNSKDLGRRDSESGVIRDPLPEYISEPKVTDISDVPGEAPNDSTIVSTDKPAYNLTAARQKTTKPVSNAITTQPPTPQPKPPVTAAVPVSTSTQPPVNTQTLAPTQQPIPQTPVPTQKAKIALPTNTVTVYGTTYNTNMTVYKARTSTTVFHMAGCSSIAEKDDLTPMTIKTAMDAGLRGCKKCFK